MAQLAALSSVYNGIEPRKEYRIKKKTISKM
jgi:hypothetical protein